MKLFAVYLGGRAPRANTELHDVVFVVGNSIEDTYSQLIAKWFGDLEGLHLDSWLELDVVDGWRVTLSPRAVSQAEKLFFINLGGYDGAFTELHANGFFVATRAEEAKKRAKAALFQKDAHTVHKDDQHDVDDCIALDRVAALHVALTYTGETSGFRPVNGYHIVPKDMIAAWLAKQ